MKLSKMTLCVGGMFLIVFSIVLFLHNDSECSDLVLTSIVGGSEQGTCASVGGGCKVLNGEANLTACQGLLPGQTCSDWYCISESVGGTPLTNRNCSSPRVDYQWCFASSTETCNKVKNICGLAGECGRQNVTYNGKTFTPSESSDAGLCGTRTTCYETWGLY